VKNAVIGNKTHTSVRAEGTTTFIPEAPGSPSSEALMERPPLVPAESPGTPALLSALRVDPVIHYMAKANLQA
jgi:hypothetical protein